MTEQGRPTKIPATHTNQTAGDAFSASGGPRLIKNFASGVLTNRWLVLYSVSNSYKYVPHTYKAVLWKGGDAMMRLPEGLTTRKGET